MPVYRLGAPQVDQERANQLFNRAFNRRGEPRQSGNGLALRSGQAVLEVDARSGDVFLADMEELWNPRRRPTLPDRGQARGHADRFLQQNGVRMRTGQNVSVRFASFSETLGGADGAAGAGVPLDRQVNYSGVVSVPGPNGQNRDLPIVGGGAKYQVSVGQGGRVIGFRGGLREVVGEAEQVEIKTQEQAIAEFRRGAGANARNIRAELAYYAAPASERQEFMAPVWVIHSQIQVGNEVIPARSQIIAATARYGPRFPASRPNPRDPNAPMPRRDDERPGQQGFLDWLIPPAHAAAGFDCGTWWIGPSQGLPGSPGNAQGFIDQCRAAGWSVPFNYGEQWAWESDWRANDDYYVDNVDLVFYTGHAGPSGWTLNNPADTSLNYTEVSGAADMWGNGDVEWIIIAACGPLQSNHYTTGTTNAFDRWRNSFDGLHVLMGYGAVTYDNTSEGRRFMELSRAGWNVIDAWFRTAWEIQPSTNGYSPPNGPNVFVVAMYAHNGDHCARNDHLWGMGSTCADVPAGAAQQRYMMWQGT